MTEDPDVGTRIIVFRALCIEKSLLTEMIRSDFFVKLFYFLSASSTATATATVAPTMGLLPMPKKPIIST